jgi:hypothetical protein
VATILIKELKGGLDTRRMPETTSGGVLIEATDGHLTRGGEFETRAAFVPVYELPAGATQGLAANLAGLVVFGDETTPVLPLGVSYQQYEHPTGQELVRVPSYDLYTGKIYGVVEFADGSIYHYYDGVRVEDWYDGRARAPFRVVGGGVYAAVSATGSGEITGGTVGLGNEVTSIVIDGVSLFSTPVAHTGNNATTAAAVASAINGFVSVPDYTATSNGQTVVITAVTPGSSINGKAIVAVVGGDVTVGNATNMAGGQNAGTSRLTGLTVDGVPIIAAPVSWATSHPATAAAIAAAINSFTSSPDYTATSVDDQVNIIATAGVSANGRVIAFTTDNGLLVTPTELALSGGLDAENTYGPGLFVKTVGSKMYSTSQSNMHFSGIQQPTQWTTDVVGAGFIDMSSQASGSEMLTALARYNNQLAVFAPRIVQMWYVDPDESNNRQTQTLNNTGTAHPRSVTQFGDSDVFYLSESGLRSLRARDSSNSAATTDIGVPVDTLITQTIRGLTDTQKAAVTGLIEPLDGRFWLTTGTSIFVFSYFAGSSISAWSLYKPTDSETGDPIDIEYAVVFDRKVYVRSGDTIYAYGGMTDELTYDNTKAIAQLPYLDADTPTQRKTLEGFDAAVQGAWEVRMAMDPVEPDANDKIAIIDRTTYSLQRVPAQGVSTHFSLIMTSQGGYARFGAAALHFAKDADAD